MASDSSDDEYEETLLLMTLLRRRLRRRVCKRSVWVRAIFIERHKQGDYHNLIQEMRMSDLQSYFRYMRMSKDTFETLLAKVRLHVNRVACALYGYIIL